MDFSKYKGRVIGGNVVDKVELFYTTLMMSFREVADGDGTSMLVAERWLDDIPCRSDHFDIDHFDNDGYFIGYDTAELDDCVVNEIKAIFDEIGYGNVGDDTNCAF